MVVPVPPSPATHPFPKLLKGQYLNADVVVSQVKAQPEVEEARTFKDKGLPLS